MTKRLIALAIFAALTPFFGCDRPTPVAPSQASITLNANPTRIAVNGLSIITVLARKADGTAVNPGTEITFTSDLGELDETVIPTDDRGIAETALRGDGRAGIATVTANSGAAMAAAIMIDVGIGASSLTLAVTPRVVSADAPQRGHKINMIATVADDDGNPIGGANVTFASEVGTFIRGSNIPANGQGEANAVLTVFGDDLALVVDGVFEVSATTAGLEAPEVAEIQVSGFPTRITLTAQPLSVPATGGVVSLTATVADGLNDPLPDAGVTFDVDVAGSLASGGQIQQTNESGQAFDVVTLTQEELVSINQVVVTAEATSGGAMVVADSKTIRIQGTPVADFTFGIVGTVATFSSAVQGDPPLTLEWDFTNDGVIDASNTLVSTAQVTQTNDYGAPGTFFCTLIVNNNFGTAVITKEVVVPEPPPP